MLPPCYFLWTLRLPFSGTTTVIPHKLNIDGMNITLIDTPGLDNPYRSDEDILRELVKWLENEYRPGFKLSGILYLHAIDRTPMEGSALRNLRMFQRLCVDGYYRSVVLGTTFWGAVDSSTGAVQERRLCKDKDFWGYMIERGSETVRILRRDRSNSIRLLKRMAARHVSTAQTRTKKHVTFAVEEDARHRVEEAPLGCQRADEKTDLSRCWSQMNFEAGENGQREFHIAQGEQSGQWKGEKQGLHHHEHKWKSQFLDMQRDIASTSRAIDGQPKQRRPRIRPDEAPRRWKNREKEAEKYEPIDRCGTKPERLPRRRRSTRVQERMPRLGHNPERRNYSIQASRTHRNRFMSSKSRNERDRETHIMTARSCPCEDSTTWYPWDSGSSCDSGSSWDSDTSWDSESSWDSDSSWSSGSFDD